METVEFDQVWNEAHKAGLKAVEELTVVPMVVQQHANPFDDDSPVTEEWFIADGVCGFAWVNIKPGNSKFANWLKATNKARRDSYYGGVTYWVNMFNQSMQKKETYAKAFAQVLRDHDIKAIAMSRLD